MPSERNSRNFLRNQDGTVAIIFTFALVLITAAVGGAIDFGRFVHAKSQTRAALDAAVLAGARVLLVGGTNAEAKTAAMSYYEKNVASRFTTVSDTVEFNIQQNGTVLTGNGNAFLKTVMLGLIGIQQLPLVTDPGTGFARAQINSGGGSDLEVAVMLDMTGSMCSDGVGPCTSSTKLDALKTAATDLVNIVVSDNQTQYTSRAALVPFAQRIRVAPNGQGAGIMQKLTGLQPVWNGWIENCTASEEVAGSTGEGGSQWVCTQSQLEQVNGWKIRPCVTERFYENGWVMGMTDEKPGIGYWLNGTSGRREPLSLDSSDTPLTSGLGATSSDPANPWSYGAGGGCWSSENNVVVPLTSDKSLLTGKIAAFAAQGETGGALGTAFTWYMLSPNWKTIWTGQSKPGEYSEVTTTQANGKPKLRKVAVIMSDGVFNARRGWGGQNQQDASNDAVQVCANMKAAGIEIYTVAFDLASLPADQRTIAEATLKACGTSLEHFYNTLDAGELQTAFRDIGVKLSSIALMR